MQANAEIFFEHDKWGRNLAWSAGLHIAVAGSIILYATIASGGKGSAWGAGGGGEAMGVTLVSSVPLPASTVQTQNVLANESKGITQSQPKAEEKEPEAIPIPDKNAKIKPKPRSSAQQKPKSEPEEEASNVVPFGEGGPVSGPYGTFNAGGEQRADSDLPAAEGILVRATRGMCAWCSKKFRRTGSSTKWILGFRTREEFM